MNKQLDEPLVDKVYVLTRHEFRSDDADEQYFNVLGVYNNKDYAHQQMILDYTSIRDEEATEADYAIPEDFWDSDWTDDMHANLRQEDWPLYYSWYIKEMEIK